MFYDSTNTTGNWVALNALLGGAVSNLVLGDGTRTDTYPCIVDKITRANPVNDFVKITVSLKLAAATTHA